MLMNRLVFSFTSLLAALSHPGFADAAAPLVVASPMAQAPGRLHDTSLGMPATLFAIALLLGGLLSIVNRRAGWRLGAVALVGGFALLGGDAMLDGAVTAIAVSP